MLIAAGSGVPAAKNVSAVTIYQLNTLKTFIKYQLYEKDTIRFNDVDCIVPVKRTDQSYSKSANK
jgi:hypothetical protein